MNSKTKMILQEIARKIVYENYGMTERGIADINYIYEKLKPRNYAIWQQMLKEMWENKQ